MGALPHTRMATLTPPPRPDKTPEEIATLWVTVARSIFRDLVAPTLGTFILTWETVAEHADRPWLIAAGITCLGIPAASWARRILLGALGEAPGPAPPGLPPEDE